MDILLFHSEETQIKLFEIFDVDLKLTGFHFFQRNSPKAQGCSPKEKRE